MTYNFDEVVERRGSMSMKWDSAPADVLPMWVADMDFRVAEPILDGLRARTEHGVFGYSLPDETYGGSVQGWFSRRHGWNLDPSTISHCPGIVPALHFLAKSFVKPGEKIMMHSPVYYPFFGSAEKNNVEVAMNPLLCVDGRYEIDFDGFEQIAKDPAVKVFYLCSPHNPGGRIWTKDELERMGKICTDNGVLVVSDEIHCDLIYSGKEFVAYGTLSEELVNNCIICIAPSKTFNLAGLQTSCLVIPNPELKKQYDTFLASLGIMRPGAYGIAGVIAAYSHGDEWLDQLMVYLEGNLEFLRTYLRENIPQIRMMEPDATYLVWMDFRDLHMDCKEFHNLLLNEGKVWLDEGYMFGEIGEGYERINIACPRSLLKEGLDRMKRALKAAGKI